MINDLGVDPNEWFDNPLDKMPIAKDEPIKYDNKYAPPEKLAELESMQSIESNPRPEEEIADEWFESNNKIEEQTPHHIAYEIATSKYNPFSIGGSESIHDFELGGGSEKIHD
tara:strand:- start:439 stop:777 length:339 start_codon:yes stop_codon:yes gene_type:complete